MALPPDESLNSKDGTILICVHCIAGTCVHEHMSPLLGEHLCIVNIFLGPTIEMFHCRYKQTNSQTDQVRSQSHDLLKFIYRYKLYSYAGHTQGNFCGKLEIVQA